MVTVRLMQRWGIVGQDGRIVQQVLRCRIQNWAGLAAMSGGRNQSNQTAASLRYAPTSKDVTKDAMLAGADKPAEILSTRARTNRRRGLMKPYGWWDPK